MGLTPVTGASFTPHPNLPTSSSQGLSLWSNKMSKPRISKQALLHIPLEASGKKKNMVIGCFGTGPDHKKAINHCLY